MREREGDRQPQKDRSTQKDGHLRDGSRAVVTGGYNNISSITQTVSRLISVS